MKYSALIALAVVFAGCKTPNTSALKDDIGGGSGDIHCTFVVPNGTGEQFDIWATTADNSGMTGVREQYTPSSAQPGSVNTIGNAQVVDSSVVNTGGAVGMRAYEKDIVNIDPKQYICYSMNMADLGSAASFFCRNSQATGEGYRALLVTTGGTQKFINALTVYRSSCTVPKS